MRKMFTYLDSIFVNHAETDADVRTRIGKERTAFHQLKFFMVSNAIGVNTNIRILQYHREANIFLQIRNPMNHLHTKNPCVHDYLPHEDP